MRIDGNHGNREMASVRLDKDKVVGEAPAAAKQASAAQGGDRLELSADAQLLKTAMQAATDAPDIRQDVVDRVRQKLQDGQLGNDSASIADSIIDHLLGN